MAHQWHRATYEGVFVPVAYYVGEVRDSDPNLPHLYGYEVAVGAARGVLSRNVPAELETFQKRMREAVSRLDAAIASGSPPATNDDLHAVIVLCAQAHGEWVRIHPYANGNGRTARLWALWVAFRYGLPPFIRLRPRPAGVFYAEAARRSMTTQPPDHSLTTTVFHDMLRSWVQRRRS